MKTAKEYIAERINPRACEEMEFSLTGKELFELMEEYTQQKFSNSSNSKTESVIPPVIKAVNCESCKWLEIYPYVQCDGCVEYSRHESN